MLKNKDYNELTNTETTEYWSIGLRIDKSYEDKWNEIVAHHNNSMEKAPSKADLFRNAIDIIHRRINGDK